MPHSGPKPKFFNRQSGQIRAVREEVQIILDVTRVLVDKLKSDPPPMGPEKPDPNAGVYSIVSGEEEVEGEGGEDQTGVVPVDHVPVPRPRPKQPSQPEPPRPRKKLSSHSDE